MKINGTILSTVVTAALALPCLAYASDTQSGVPGSTDEAKVLFAAHRAARSQPADVMQGYDDPAAVLRATTSDEARLLTGQRRPARAPLALRSDCMQAGGMPPGQTDEAKLAFGRRLSGAYEACAPQG